MTANFILDKDQFYPLIDRYPFDSVIMAKWTGEKRPPKKGEWYLSGAIICAYKAEVDLTTPYHIARIVRVRKVEYWEEILP